MNWNKTSETSPPDYNLRVLGWKECDKCRQQERHGHWMIEHSGESEPFITYYCRGNKSIKEIEEDYWSPIEPTYWCYIQDPITGKLLEE